MRHISAFILIYFCFYTLAHGQDYLLLEKKLKDDKLSTTEKIDILNVLSRDLHFIEPAKSLDYANKALELSVKINYKTGIAYAYRNLSNMHTINENFFNSLDYIQLALDIFESLNDSAGIANCYITLGHTYRGLLDRKNEIYYHKRAYEIFNHLKVPGRIAIASHNLGESYYNIGDYENAEKYTLYAIRLNDSLNNKSVLSSCYKVMGLIEYKQKKYLLAEGYFNSTLKISTELNNKSQKVATVEALTKLAELNKLKGKINLQMDLLKKAAKLSEENQLSYYLQEIYLKLILISSEKNDQESLQKYIKEYKIFSDSIRNKQLTDKSYLANSVMHVHRLEKEALILEQTNMLQQNRIRNRNIILIIVFVFSLLLIWLISKLYFSNKKLHGLNNLLELQQKTIENQNIYLEELNKAKDKFFSIVAHDLKSPLYNMKSFSELLINNISLISKDEIADLSKKFESSVDSTIEMADNLIIWAKMQMRDNKVSPKVIDLNQLIISVYNIYSRIADDKEIKLTYSLQDNLKAFADKDQITFIIRNLINNAIKFTNKNGSIHISAKELPENSIEISISDTGVGIPADLKDVLFKLDNIQSTEGTAGEKGTGLGLTISAEFVKLNKASINFTSQKDKGTTFTLILNKAKSTQP